MKFGDFTKLADDYAKFRPGYAETVLNTLITLSGKEAKDLRVADVGAGTGIWSRMLAAAGCQVTAVEPNDAMREQGIAQSEGCGITWVGAPAEETTLEDNAFDIVTMASSFHWPDYDTAMNEFSRVLKPGGLFMALWNSRNIKVNPLLVQIEDHLKALVPELKRVSSGQSEFCDGLLDRFCTETRFSEPLYMEGRHVELQTPDHYLGLWKSVNDIRVQAGPERFEQFLEYIVEHTSSLEHIEATYRTMAWCVKNAKA